MTQDSSLNQPSEQIPEAVVKTKKSFSIVWVVPLVAILIGGWMVYKAISEKGPVITISFVSAEGLEAEKTKIKYRDVELGQVTSIHFSPDLKRIVVTAELPKQATAYLTDKTRFWVVRARVSSGEISALGTLLGGAYIEMDPNQEGQPQRDFVGLERPPIISTDAPGRHFRLKAGTLGSLKPGSPIYYRQIKAGKVEGYTLPDNGQDIDIRIFIDHPFHEHVRTNTRFWNAGGIDLSLNANGLKLKTQSLVSIISGGLAFDNLAGFEQDDPAEKDQVFKLYDSYDDALQKEYTVIQHWTLDFRGSVRGLKPGAPVEFKGIQVGKVLEGRLNFSEAYTDIIVSVLIETNPERLMVQGAILEGDDFRDFFDSLVAQGLRAQLKTGSILTGQLLVGLDFHTNTPARQIVWEGKYPNFPTIPKTSEEVLSGINKMVEKLQAFPFQKIGRDLQAVVENLKKTTQQLSTGEVASIMSNLDDITEQIRSSDMGALVEDLNQAVNEIGSLSQNMNSRVETELKATLLQAEETLLAVEQMLSADSEFTQESTRALRNVADAASRIRALADFLERHPDALIYGKGE
jgi:paraquat-inducible protein B